MYQFQTQKREPDEAENASSFDESISSAIQSALQQLILNQAVTAFKNGVDEVLDVLYEDTREQE